MFFCAHAIDLQRAIIFRSGNVQTSDPRQSRGLDEQCRRTGGQPSESAFAVGAVLFTDLPFYLLLVETNGRDRRSACPELFPCGLYPAIWQSQSRFAFEKPDHRRHRIFRWDRHAQMNVIGHQMTFQNLVFSVDHEIVKYHELLPQSQKWA